MHDHGHQHHHGVHANIVEGVGGVIIGAAAVLLLATLFRQRKTEADTSAAPLHTTGPAASATAGARTESTEH